MIRPPPRSTLSPYTTLFRSLFCDDDQWRSRRSFAQRSRIEPQPAASPCGDSLESRWIWSRGSRYGGQRNTNADAAQWIELSVSERKDSHLRDRKPDAGRCCRDPVAERASGPDDECEGWRGCG